MQDLLSIGTHRRESMIGTGIGLGLSGFRLKTGPSTIPESVGNLQLWFDAADANTLLQSAGGSLASADGDPVGQWLDKSGNGRHATQSDGTKKPALKLAVKNSKNSVLFDGVNDLLSLPSVVTVAPATLFYVLQRTASATFTVPLGHSTAYPFNWYADNFIYVYTSSGYYSFSGGTGSGWYLIDQKKSGSGTATTEVNRNGTQIDSRSHGGSFQFDRIGSTQGVDFHKGYLSEILIYDKALPSDETTKIRDYLKSKWSIY